MHAISFSLSFMHDIAGYMLCSLELNMQALFMYTYLCVAECVQVGVCTLFRHLLSFPITSMGLWMCVFHCVSRVACLEAAEL